MSGRDPGCPGLAYYAVGPPPGDERGLLERLRAAQHDLLDEVWRGNVCGLAGLHDVIAHAWVVSLHVTSGSLTRFAGHLF